MRPHLVGGAIRDVLLGRPVMEADVVVSGSVERFVERAAEVLSTHAVALGRRFELWRLPLEVGHIDVVPLRGAGIEADLALRDLTINSMAVPLGRLREEGGLEALRAESVIDPWGGMRDLAARELRLTRPDAMQADPARALRVVRLARELDFAVPPQTVAAMRAASGRLGDVAAERVGAELQRLLNGRTPSRAWRLMDDCGLLTACFEALESGRGLEQRPFHRYSVLEHELVAAEWMDVLLAAQRPDEAAAAQIWDGLWNGADWSESNWGSVHAHLERHAPVLRAATLLHDAGKPATLALEPDGRTRFFGHSEAGAELARSMLTHWRFPSVFIERVAKVIVEHLRPGQVGSPGRPPTPRALHRFQRSLGDATPDVCWLFLADSLATVGPEVLLPRWPSYVSHVHRIITWSPPPIAASARRVIDGHAVMAATGIRSGPRVGQLLDAATEALAAGEVRSAEEVLALVRRLAQSTDAES
jgi:putative nucleotidyltransferase with HDIG domain